MDAAPHLPPIPWAMAPPLLMQALYLHFRPSMAEFMCKGKGKHAAASPGHLSRGSRQMLRLGGRLSLAMRHVGLFSQGREAVLRSAEISTLSVSFTHISDPNWGTNKNRKTLGHQCCLQPGGQHCIQTCGVPEWNCVNNQCNCSPATHQ